MNKFNPINLYTNPQPIPSTFNEGFSQYETIKYLIGLVNQLIENQNSDVDELADLHQKKADLEFYLTDLKNNRKLSENGDFTGTLNGYPIVKDVTGLNTYVASHETQIKTMVSQLNDIIINKIPFKAEKTYVDTQDMLKRDKATPINMSDLGQDVKTAMSGGSVAVVGVDAVQNINLTLKAVTPDKTSFMDKTNRFDYTKITLTSYINEANGQPVNCGLTPYFASDFIYCKDVTSLVTSSTLLYSQHHAYYDVNKNYLGSLGHVNGVFAIPSNAYYIRVSLTIDQQYGVIPEYIGIYVGSTLPKQFIPYNNIPQTSDIITENNGNLYNKNTAVNGYIPSRNGANGISPDSVYATTDYIKLDENTNYLCKGTYTNGLFYDCNKAYISGLSANGKQFTTPFGCCYARLTMLASDINTFWVIKNKNGYQYINTPKPFVTTKYKGISLNDRVLEGLKITQIGDSITNQALYLDGYYEKLGISSFQNLGVSGTNTQDIGSMTRINQIDIDTNFVVVMSGTNDYAQNCPIGNVTDTVLTTFCGRINTLITNLLSKFKSRNILYVGTPFGALNRLIPNGVGLSTQDYSDAIMQVCKRRGIACMDLNRSGFCLENADVYYQGEVSYFHPNNIGGQVIGNLISNEIIKMLA